jgi:hypothetical protein
MPPSSERRQIKSMLSSAARYVLDEGFTAAVDATAREATATVEQSLDALCLPRPITWVEYPESARQSGDPMSGTFRPERTGALLCEYPDDRRLVLCTCAWGHPEHGAHHAYAMLRWDTERMGQLARSARTEFSRDGRESFARMMAEADVFVPEGLKAELREWGRAAGTASDDAGIAEAAFRDASSEHVFLACAVLLMQTRSATSVDDGHGSTVVSLSGKDRPWPARQGFSAWRGILGWRPLRRPLKKA